MVAYLLQILADILDLCNVIMASRASNWKKHTAHWSDTVVKRRQISVRVIEETHNYVKIELNRDNENINVYAESNPILSFEQPCNAFLWSYLQIYEFYTEISIVCIPIWISLLVINLWLFFFVRSIGMPIGFHMIIL